MKIRNRLATLKDLETIILQEFLLLEVQYSNYKDTWKHLLQERIDKYGKRFPAQYQGAKNTIEEKGESDYSFSNMDITIIIALHKGNPWPPVSRFKGLNRTISILTLLADDRNYESHIKGSESDLELLGWACATLYDLQEFIKSVKKAFEENCKDAPAKEQLEAFHRKYIARTNSLLNLVEEDYNKSIRYEIAIDHEMDLLGATDNSLELYRLLNELWLKEYPDGWYCFIQAASKKNIPQAQRDMAQVFFGLHPKCEAPDYIKAADYYEKLHNHLTAIDRINLASIYLNNIKGPEKRKKGAAILEEMKSWAATQKNSKKIVSYKKDGYSFYRFE